MLVTLGWLLLLGPLHPTPVTAMAPSQQGDGRQAVAGGIAVWVDREQPYRPGDRVRTYFRTDHPGHVTVLRVDTDGLIRTLFPRDPWRRAYVRAGRTLEVADARQRFSFTVDDGPGIGYLIAITSRSPFDYEEITRGDYWDFRLIEDGRIRGDPYVALTDLARRIAPRGNYQYDIAPYYVGRRYDYPRFACYDCHSYATYDEWDPYASSCVRYRVVIYDDPAYYPYRYSQGRNVVTVRPLRPAPRYVFKDRRPGTDYVTRQRQRESHEVRRSRIDRDRTSADVGGQGAIPAPGVSAGERLLPESPGVRRPVPRRVITEPSPRPRPTEDRPAPPPPVQRGARDPQSTGEPELRRRKP